MKMVYTNESHFLVTNVRNLIEAKKINTFLKNEFAQGAVGETSAFDSWPEVWVFDDLDFNRAIEIVKLSESPDNTVDWTCNNCSEENDPSFEVCWNCQGINSSQVV
jgi:hypothetical protein